MAEEDSKLPLDIDFDLDNLDDAEFNIPPVANPPTLESILNERDDTASVADEDFLPPELIQGDTGDTGSVCSVEGILGDRPRAKKRKKSVRYAEHGPVVRHVVLKGVSAQVTSAADRVDSGKPTALAVSSLIAVGTSHGVVLVFDPKQVLKWCLGSPAVGAQYGAVSALSFNRDCSRLLSGFAKGQITMWDLTNGKLIRTITDAHPPGAAILHVKFTDDLTLAVTSDSGGSVFELEFKRLIGIRSCESKCLFSGSRGEVCTIEPLHVNNQVLQDHPMKDTQILAMGSLSKILIVTLRPQLRVLCMQELKGDPSTLPLLAWHFVIIQVSARDRVIDPVLAYARDQTIHFLQVVCNSPEDIKVVPLQKTELPYKLLSISWVNSRTLVVIDTLERAHILDVRTEEELEVIDLADVQLVYSTSFYKSLATGGNVSKALAYAGERACYHSVVSYSGQLALLGTKGIHVLTIRSWRERLDMLLRQSEYDKALSLALAFYEGKAKAVVGLYGATKKRKAVVSEKILTILDEYVDRATTSLCPAHGKMEELEEHYQRVVPICVNNCLVLDRLDILFGSIYDRFSADPIARATFLECLEPYILEGRLPSITPVVMREFVEHYETREMVHNVEACILHMDIASLDIHQVVSMCWQHGLYDAILYIYNKGMLDYLTPLDDLMTLLMGAVNTGRSLQDQQIRLGNKLLVYISCCLAGRAYPIGDIPLDQVSKVKDEVFAKVTCLHTKNHPEDEPAYPYLKTLLKFDTREFFNVLALAFEEPEFNSSEGVEDRQRVVDILLQIMVESIGFTPTQIGILFTFLARQMARHENTILVNRVLFEQVLESLCGLGEGETDAHHEERQQALIELLGAGGLEHFNEQRLLKLSEAAKFYRVCENLYLRRKEYDKILSCYWRDTARRHQSFSYIEHIMTSEHYSRDDKEKIQVEALGHIKELVEIDSQKAASLVLACFTPELDAIVRTLTSDETLLLGMLDGVYDHREGSTTHPDQTADLNPAIQEMYIDLLCKHRPAEVYSYIQTAEGYRLEETLKVCRQHQLAEPTAYLLEKMGDVKGAFTIMLENLQNRIQELSSVIESSTEEGRDLDKDIIVMQNVTVCWSSLRDSLGFLVDICQRNSSNLSETEREELWFPLLDAIMAPQRRIKNRHQTQAEGFKDITRQVLNSMLGFIPLPTVLKKIMQDPVYSSGNFGEVKDLLLGMLDTYNYEKTLLHTCNNLVNHDLYRQLAILRVTAGRAVVPSAETCSLCSKHYTAESSDKDAVICFRCGHGYHLPCLRSVGSMVTIDGEVTWTCYLCNKTKRRGNVSTSRTQRQLSGSSATSKPAAVTTANKKVSSETSSLLEPVQIQAIDNLRRVQKTPSRLAILTELARQERAGGPQNYRPPANSIFQNELFQLRLAHPPPDTSS